MQLSENTKRTRESGLQACPPFIILLSVWPLLILKAREQEAAVYRERLAGDVRTFLRSEQQGKFRDVR